MKFIPISLLSIFIYLYFPLRLCPSASLRLILRSPNKQFFLGYLLWLCLAYSFCAEATSPFEATKNLPVAHQGRFRSLDSSARLWLYDLYHLQRLKQDQLSLFNTNQPDALDLLWKVHFLGHIPIDNAPIFWIHYASLKSLLGLELTKARFSFNELTHALFDNKETNLRAMRRLLTYEFAKNYHSTANQRRSEKIELRSLATGLWVVLREDSLILAASPKTPPWNNLNIGMMLTDKNINLKQIEKEDRLLAEELLQLFQSIQGYVNLKGSQLNLNSEKLIEKTLKTLKQQETAVAEIAQILENQFPISTRLQNAGSILKILPSRLNEGEWLSLHALKVKVYDPKSQQLTPISNFTSFSETSFKRLRQLNAEIETAALEFYNSDNSLDHKDLQSHLEKIVEQFDEELKDAYSSLAGNPYKTAIGKKLIYPSLWQLKAETLYYRLPLIEVSLVGYTIALLLFLAAYRLKRKILNLSALIVLTGAFFLHSAVLALRCFILQRPPVSNMFETVVYVPWIAVIVGFLLKGVFRSQLPLIAACTASLGLLILLKLTDVNAHLENVQAVLDSQYWLIVHVLMIVGSYGVFIICGILGHFFLLANLMNRQNKTFIAQYILQTMYIGVALLIPGTILGGVWAAESWGRFWDWDPKESWAFISVCIYLLIIHAYTFRKIRDFGLAIGSVAGLMAISFTWYGVNYILGTGLHSYGFGKGGEWGYFAYLLGEIGFLGITSIFHFLKKNPQNNH